MKVLVLGAGVIGVTTAYYLSRAGFQVTILDRQQGPGLETSFANAGEISPGYASPWAAPGMPLKAARWMLDKYGPLVVRPQFDPWMWRWVLQMLRNCTSARYAVNKARMLGIAEYSRDCLRELRRDEAVTYDDRSQGTLQLFRKQSQLDAICGDVDILREYSVPYEVLDAEGCMRAEPGLRHARVPIVGGLRLPDDETGDCYMFTRRLEQIAVGLGVRTVYGVTVASIDVDGGRVARVSTDMGVFTADKYVVALGSFSPLLLRPLGLDIPVYPVKGYSLTIPVADERVAPQSTVMDETYKVAITRLGERIRVGGTAEVGSFRMLLRQNRRLPLERSLGDLFPDGGDAARAQFWMGLRPMTPDGPPVIGPTPFDNLILNTGHGTLGWTMACGAGRVVADLIGGRASEILIDGLSINRYARG